MKANEEEDEEDEQFIINDYYWWAERRKPNENFRGVSIVVNHQHQQEKQKGMSLSSSSVATSFFDLHLHGAISPAAVNNNNNNKNEGLDARGDGGGSGGNKKNRLLIAKNLKKSHWYTLQVKWGAEIKQRDGSVLVLPSFYALYDYDRCLTRQSFKNTLIAEEIYPVFYLGGFVYGTKNTINVPSSSSSSSVLPRIIQKKSNSRMVKSKCFTGVVCNLEILKSSVKNIPSELLDFIVKRQKMKNQRMPPAAAASAHDDIKKDVWMMSSSSL